MKRTVHIEAAELSKYSCDCPAPGAQRVSWKIDGRWVHVGWLMPGIR